MRDLILPVEDLKLRSASLDNSVSTEESNKRVEVSLAADVFFRFDSAVLTGHGRLADGRGRAKVRDDEPSSST